MGWVVVAGRKIRANRLLLMEAGVEVKPERVARGLAEGTRGAILGECGRHLKNGMSYVRRSDRGAK